MQFCWRALGGPFVLAILLRPLHMSSLHQARLEKRNAKRSQPKSYYKTKVDAHGQKKWQGGPDLASSAAYPWQFCRAVRKVWEKLATGQV